MPTRTSPYALSVVLAAASVVLLGVVDQSSAAAGATGARSLAQVAVGTGAVPFGLRPDFNGDLFSDLAVGVHGETLDAESQGAVNVIYGSATGLVAAENQLWSQDAPGIVGTGEFNDDFGQAVGWADFNGDGFDDLAVGVPGDLVDGKDDAGAVNVIYGSAAGLTSTGNQLWSQASPGMPGTAQDSDFFGNALVGRDFDNDGFGDLVIGAFGDRADGRRRDTGTIQVLYGSAAGLAAGRSEQFAQLKGKPEKYDWFGYSLAAGYFDDDGYTDLAIGVPQEEVGDIDLAGAVNVIYGSASGLTAEGNQLWHQDVAGVAGDVTAGDRLGASLSAADFDGDGLADLAIGIELDTVGGKGDAGSALVLRGSDAGLAAAGSQLWNQDAAGVADVAEVGDAAGDVTAGDFDADGFADLAIGFSHEEVLALTAVGAVNVVYGTATGLSSTGNQIWYQDGGIAGAGAENDYFGSSLTRADYDGDGFADLVIGVPGDGTLRSEGGSVNVVYGSGAGLAVAGNQLWNQNSAGILDANESNDWFGDAVAER